MWFHLTFQSTSFRPHFLCYIFLICYHSTNRKNGPLLPPVAPGRGKIEEFSPQNLTNTAWSFAKVMVLDGSLLEAVWTVGASQRRAVANRGIEASEADRFDFHKFHEVSISSWWSFRWFQCVSLLFPLVGIMIHQGVWKPLSPTMPNQIDFLLECPQLRTST